MKVYYVPIGQLEIYPETDFERTLLENYEGCMPDGVEPRHYRGDGSFSVVVSLNGRCLDEPEEEPDAED